MANDTKNFKVTEFSCHCGCGFNIVDQRVIDMAQVNELTNATDGTERLNPIVRGAMLGALDPALANNLLNFMKPTQTNVDLGGSIVPTTFDPYTGQVTSGDAWTKTMTPAEAAQNAYNLAVHNDKTKYDYAVLNENARQFDVNDAFRRQSNYQLINGGDGQYYRYDQRTGQHEPTGIPAPKGNMGQIVTIPKDVEATLKLNEQERKNKS